MSLIKQAKHCFFKNIENIRQTGFLLGLFGLASSIFSRSWRFKANQRHVGFLEQYDSLKVVQNILYNDDIMFLILSVFILLIALIGAAVFVKTPPK